MGKKKYYGRFRQENIEKQKRLNDYWILVTKASFA